MRKVKCSECGKVIFGRSLPDVRCYACALKRERARQQTPEYKAYQQAYHQTPEYKAKRRARWQTPEYKAKHRAYQQAYRQTLEAKAKRRAYDRARCHAKKQAIRPPAMPQD